MPEAKLIYVIDDDTALRTAYSANLKGLGFRVEEAADGVEGLELIKKQVPSLIVLDMLMPRLNGLDMLKEMETLALNPAPRVLVVSSFESLPEDHTVKIDKYMSKMQFGPDEVGATIEAMLK